MHQSLIAISDNLEAAQTRLLEHYDADQLYAFRVATRRIRSILKRIGSHRSRSLRKTWGGYSAVSNDARDWDVFLITAKKLLSTQEFSEFETSNRQCIIDARLAVSAMLDSVLWRNHLQTWRELIKRADEQGPSEELPDDALEQALIRAREVLGQARVSDDDRSWHKFRISVKEVRYIADALAQKDEGNEVLSEIRSSCRELQTELGDWHDTVVQLDLLGELAQSPVHDKLTALIRERRTCFLSRTRDLLADHPLFSDSRDSGQ